MVEPIAVLFVIDYFRDPNAGTEGQLFNLIRGLDKKKVVPHLLVFEESPWLKSNDFPCQYSVLGSRSLKSPLTWLGLFRLARIMRKRGIKLAHVFFNDPSLICPPVFFLNGIRTIISRRDMGYWYTPSLKRLLRFTGCFVSGVVVNSEAVKKVTVEAEGFSDRVVSVIYNGFEDASSISSNTQEFASKLKLLKDQNRILVVLVANIRPIKRIDDVIRAVGMLKNSNSNIDLIVIGSGDASELKGLAYDLDIAGRVHFMGACSDVAACLNYMDIGVLSSESEGFSNSLVEYMRAGLPVVCSSVGGNPEAVESDVNGFLYPVGDAEKLKKAIEILANDGELRVKMGEAGKCTALKRYNMSRMVSAHTDLYRSFLSQ